MKRSDLEVYFIMGAENCKEDPLIVLEEALSAGVTFFQFREKGDKGLKGNEYIKFAKQCQKLCKQYNVPFIVNDDVDLALTLNADGAHVGQDDLPLKYIRKQFEGKIVGVSVHTEEEMYAAVQGGADYVGIGPIFETISKPDAKPAAGVSFLSRARYNFPNFPIVAIGGITTENANEVIRAGADGVAVISAISQSRDRKATVQKFKKLKK
ncbi:thiamine phosphate synthase [Lysinibacillus telephonicus]|uniref:Thiamine-phosphate synthase n=1 Tax=Lysinibacillus telephonicus TaxID=1714840 RepID=A0A3S0I479_9BACI|nr:thiamine phosphate synthase [Lysinibacillus telephonicus]RTQ96070.1 thiamine phosphate synthase [Lysinibacillus telephonicus]